MWNHFRATIGFTINRNINDEALSQAFKPNTANTLKLCQLWPLKNKIIEDFNHSAHSYLQHCEVCECCSKALVATEKAVGSLISRLK